MSTRYDQLSFRQGETFKATITWQAGNPPVAVNLTGYTGKMQLKTDNDALTAALEISTANGRMVLGGVAGTITILVIASVTVLIAPFAYVYDLVLTDAGGIVTPLLDGTILCEQRTTT